MATVDAEYCFISIDVSALEKEGDSRCFKKIVLRKTWSSRTRKLIC